MSGPRILVLVDGRRLAYRSFGPEDGLPVVSCHGGLSCSAEIAFAEPLCHQLRVRLLAPDRPGIGFSDPQRGRRLLDWSADVAALADHLGIGRFAVLGWSAGAPYALSCSVALPQRVDAVGVLAGMAPLDDSASIAELGLWADRVLFRLCRYTLTLPSAWLALNRLRSHASIQRSVLRALAGCGDGDLELVSALAPSEIAAPLLESIARGARGTATDYRLLGAPWGFAFDAVRAPTFLWHGGADGFVPYRHAERLAAALTEARLALLDGYGHFLPRRILPQVLRALTRPERQKP